MELRFAQGVARIVDRTVEALGLDEADLRLAELHGAPRTSAPAPLAAPVATSDPGAERPPSQVITSAVMLTNMGGGLGAMAAAQLSVATALGAVSGGGLGLVFAAVTARALRRQQQERAARGQAVKFVQQTLGPTARERVHTPLKERLLDVRQALDATLRRCAERRGAELGDALTEQKRLRNASALERQRTAREAAGRLALLGQWRGELQRLDSGLRAGTEG
jgi:hypothetical protein